VQQTLTVRTKDVDRVERTARALNDLTRTGALSVDYAEPSYYFTRLNDLRAPMIGEATASARLGAQEFANDSKSRVGSIKDASQGYFEIEGRDTAAGEESTQLFKRVRVVTTVAYQLGGVPTYALEGSIFVAGAVVQWLRDGLGIITSSAHVEELAKKADNNGGLFLVPAFAGLGAPYWNGEARGMMVGMTRGTTAAHIARASLESIALQTRDVLTAMEKDAGTSIQELRVDGGATTNDLLMQIQADVLQTRVVRPQITETTAAGAAYLAGLAVGFWRSADEIQQQWKVERVFSPSEEAVSETLIKGWRRAVKACQIWTEC
jgi:glycerol kinase